MQNDYLGQHDKIVFHHLMINSIFEFVFDKLPCNGCHDIKFYKWDILIQYNMLEKVFSVLEMNFNIHCNCK